MVLVLPEYSYGRICLFVVTFILRRKSSLIKLVEKPENMNTASKVFGDKLLVAASYLPPLYALASRT